MNQTPPKFFFDKHWLGLFTYFPISKKVFLIIKGFQLILCLVANKTMTRFVSLCVLSQHKASSQFILFFVFISIFFLFLYLVKIHKLIFLFVKDDVAFLKC